MNLIYLCKCMRACVHVSHTLCAQMEKMIFDFWLQDSCLHERISFKNSLTILKKMY